MPVWLAPYAAAVVIVAGAVGEVVPPGSTAATVCKVILIIGSAYGIMSAGARK